MKFLFLLPRQNGRIVGKTGTLALDGFVAELLEDLREDLEAVGVGQEFLLDRED